MWELLCGGRVVIARLRWIGMAIARAIEYGVVLATVGASAWTFALIATVAYHHYDIVYRPRTRGRDVPRWVRRAAGTWPGRCALLAAGWWFGQVHIVAGVLTVALAVVFVGETLVDLARDRRMRRRATPDASSI